VLARVPHTRLLGHVQEQVLVRYGWEVGLVQILEVLVEVGHWSVGADEHAYDLALVVSQLVEPALVPSLVEIPMESNQRESRAWTHIESTSTQVHAHCVGFRIRGLRGY
jgi:hypothetical protein